MTTDHPSPGPASDDAGAAVTDAALARSSALLEGIVQLASDGIISIDEDQRIRLFNAGAEEIFGYAAHEVLGHPLEMLIPARYRAAHQAEHLPHFAGAHETARRMGARREVFGLRKGGEEFPAEVSISKVGVGGRMMYNAVVRDATERRRYEAALRERGEALARSNAELEQFAYVASHDLQEPLRMVASYTQLLARRYGGQLDEKADRYIAFAVDGAQRMQGLINDLLALSRVGTQGKPFTRVDVGAVVARVLRWLGPTLEQSGGAVTVGPMPTVRADAGQLEQVFQNLVANALKFHRPGSPAQVTLTAERLPAQSGAAEEWVFAVHDNGIGFEPQFAEQIFLVFQRLHTRAEYPGTGVGLAIVKKIVERHGGRLWAESVPNEGATFYFTIPHTS